LALIKLNRKKEYFLDINIILGFRNPGHFRNLGWHLVGKCEQFPANKNTNKVSSNNNNNSTLSVGSDWHQSKAQIPAQLEQGKKRLTKKRRKSKSTFLPTKLDRFSSDDESEDVDKKLSKAVDDGFVSYESNSSGRSLVDKVKTIY
jgi:hypothetical protein